MNEITDIQIQQIYPQSTGLNRAKYLPYFNQYLGDYEINTPIRLWSYFAQIGHESGQLRYCEEIASGKAYEGRLDLGNTEVGDGVRFKGRGLIQITGRSNYKTLSYYFDTDFVGNPQLLEQPEWAVKSTLWYWDSRGLNAISDSGDFEKLTRRVNGGLNGLTERKAIFERCKLYLV
jgi:putative chitinase